MSAPQTLHDVDYLTQTYILSLEAVERAARRFQMFPKTETSMALRRALMDAETARWEREKA